MSKEVHGKYKSDLILQFVITLCISRTFFLQIQVKTQGCGSSTEISDFGL